MRYFSLKGFVEQDPLPVALRNLCEESVKRMQEWLIGAINNFLLGGICLLRGSAATESEEMASANSLTRSTRIWC